MEEVVRKTLKIFEFPILLTVVMGCCTVWGMDVCSCTGFTKDQPNKDQKNKCTDIVLYKENLFLKKFK